MASSVASSFERLKKTVADGNYYEAQQLIKVLYFRNYTQHKIEVAKEILVEGALTMLKANQPLCATELVNLLLTLYVDSHVIVDSNSIDTISQLASCFPAGDKGKISCLKSALKWASSSESYKQGQPFLHAQLARSYVELQEYSQAQRHYLKANQPREFAAMLISWANQGYNSEKDLFIARSVLMYLSLGNIEDAKLVYQIFIKAVPSIQNSPLVNFLKLLLLTVEFKTYSVFEVLRKKYQSSLTRDPSFNQYLSHIAQVYYGKKQAGTGAGGFGNLLTDLFSNFMSNDNDVELGAEDVD